VDTEGQTSVSEATDRVTSLIRHWKADEWKCFFHFGVHIFFPYCYFGYLSVLSFIHSLHIQIYYCRYKPTDRIWSWTPRTLESWVRIPLETWMYVCDFLCCVVLCR